MRTRRQKIQLELALAPVAKGEARAAVAEGTEVRVARAAPERPAAGLAVSMEAVVEPGNLSVYGVTRERPAWTGCVSRRWWAT